MNLSRRSLIAGLGTTLICAPAIVRASSLMKVKRMVPFVACSEQVQILPTVGQKRFWSNFRWIDTLYDEALEKAVNPAWVVDGDKPIRQLPPDEEALSILRDLRAQFHLDEPNPP